MKIDNKYYYLQFFNEFDTPEGVTEYSFNEKYKFMQENFYSILGEDDDLEPDLLEVRPDHLSDAFKYYHQKTLSLFDEEMDDGEYFDAFEDLWTLLWEMAKDLIQDKRPNNRYRLALKEIKDRAKEYDIKYNMLDNFENITNLLEHYDIKSLRKI